MNSDDDPVISTLPIHLTNTLSRNIHIHQFPLLNRPLEVPPSAALSGKRIRARHKPEAQRFEIHIPVDTRPEVWNTERARELGTGRAVEDKEKNQDAGPSKPRESEEPRLSEVRLRSESISKSGSYMLGVVRRGQLHLHPVGEIHQLRPTLTYLDVLSRKQRRSRGDDSDVEEGPPPDPDEPVSAPASSIKDKGPVGEAKDVQVAARKTDDRAGQGQGGVSAVRREMLEVIRREEEERWIDYDFFDPGAAASTEAFEAIFSHEERHLLCTSDITSFLKDSSP